MSKLIFSESNETPNFILGKQAHQSRYHLVKLDLNGIVKSGLGQGAYFMSLNGYKKQFKSKLGYVPFPGTLNIELTQKAIEKLSKLNSFNGILVSGFSDLKRNYGWVKCFHAILNHSINCQLIISEKTHHDNSTIEVIGPHNIKKTENLTDGTQIILSVIGMSKNSEDQLFD